MRRSPDGAHDFDRGSVLLGIASIVFAGFVFGAALPTEFDFVNVGATGAVILRVSGALAIICGTTRRPALYAAAGVLLTIAALVQLAGLAASVRPLGGDASTMAVMGGLGIGLLTLSFAVRSLSHTHDSDER